MIICHYLFWLCVIIWLRLFLIICYSCGQITPPNTLTHTHPSTPPIHTDIHTHTHAGLDFKFISWLPAARHRSRRSDARDRSRTGRRRAGDGGPSRRRWHEPATATRQARAGGDDLNDLMSKTIAAIAERVENNVTSSMDATEGGSRRRWSKWSNVQDDRCDRRARRK
jgi:hypothetical protein